jgi:trimeric autotransporter adhesin
VCPLKPADRIDAGKTKKEEFMNTHTKSVRKRSLYRLGIALVLPVLWLASICAAQSTNTLDGYQAGVNITTGQGDSCYGYQACYNTTTGGNGVGGTHNAVTAFGYQAGFSNTTAGSNAFFGTWAGYSTTGNNNTFLGNQAGESDTTGGGNTFSGTFAGQFNTTGSENSFYGYQAGGHNTGNSNIFMGWEAGTNSTSGSNDIYIGNEGPSPGTESETIRIGTSQNAAFIAGIFDSVATDGLPVYVDSLGQLGTQTSSMRFKEQVRDMGDRTEDLMRLRPVTFFYKPEYEKGQRNRQYGLIAEEVAKVYPDLVVYDQSGAPYAVRYQYIATMLLNEVQKQNRREEGQAEQIKAQEQQIESLQQQLKVRDSALQLQNASLQQRLSRLEGLVHVEVASAK